MPMTDARSAGRHPAGPVASERAPAAVAPIPPDQGSLAERYSQLALEGLERHRGDFALRALDAVVALLALMVLSPLLLVVALFVRLSSRGPALYRGRRVGRFGRVFTMYKFRTLRPDAEMRLGPYLGTDLTQRTVGETTVVGRILRASQADELPQLWNVLRGDMSLVGPRPIRPAFFEELCQEIPQYWQRLVVRPGMTGFAQLRMTREMSWSEKLAHDLEYIADRSPRLYLTVVAATAWRLLTRPFRAIGRRLRGSG